MDNQNSEFEDNATNALYQVFSYILQDSENPGHVMDNIYPFSNENIYEGISHLDLTDKKVCTVGSSGDQLLNSLLLGAKDITLIDGNQLSRYYTELKIASIKGLTYLDFLDYFTRNNLLNHKYYSKISHLLPPDVQQFWDTIILETNQENYNEIISQFVFGTRNRFTSYTFAIGKKLQPYFNNVDKFYQLKNILLNGDYQIKYKTGLIEKFNSILEDEKFDLIMLSNIYDYCDTDIYIKAIDDLSINNLNRGGIIQLNYIFSVYRAQLIKDFTLLLQEELPNLKVSWEKVSGHFDIPDIHLFGKENHNCM